MTIAQSILQPRSSSSIGFIYGVYPFIRTIPRTFNADAYTIIECLPRIVDIKIYQTRLDDFGRHSLSLHLSGNAHSRLVTRVKKAPDTRRKIDLPIGGQLVKRVGLASMLVIKVQAIRRLGLVC